MEFVGEDEARAFAADVEALGLRTSLQRRATRLDGVEGHADEIFKLVIGVIGGAGALTIGLNSFLRAVTELPKSAEGFVVTLRKFLTILRPRRSTSSLHNSLMLPQINHWLDERHGAGAWSYDPSELKHLQCSWMFTIFAIREQQSGTLHLLAVRGRGDEVVEVPLEWLPSASDPPAKLK